MHNHLNTTETAPFTSHSDDSDSHIQLNKPSATIKKVAIIQRALPQYRKDFFNLLHKKLAASGVELTLLYGKFKSEDSLKKDEVDLPWGTYLPNKVFRLRNTELIWQPCLPYLADKDLVIVEQANRNILNYYLILKRFLRNTGTSLRVYPHRKHSSPSGYKPIQKLAFWGHGRNLQAAENSITNRFKKLYINQCDWWFAYTQNVKYDLASNNFPDTQVTCVQNAIDTQSLTAHYQSIPVESSDALKKELGINSNHIGIYCGGMYKEKRLQFLIDAGEKIREKVNDFHLIVIGSGPDAYLIEEAAGRRDWIHYIGPQFGLHRVKYFKISSLFLMPGLVGLAILDSFAMRTPMVTTAFPFHSPEIEYLKNGENGIMTPDTLSAYSDTVVRLLSNETERQKLITGCVKSSDRYTVEQMVENFANGILTALNSN